MEQEDAVRFRLRLGETLAWLKHAQPFAREGAMVVRTSALKLEELSQDPMWAADHPREAVGRIVEARAARLKAESVSDGLPPVLPVGRVLLLLTSINLMDGAGVEPSGGFVDESNLPMCDCWIDWFERVPMKPRPLPPGSSLRAVVRSHTPALACWIPGNLIERAQGAVTVNPESCLVWADEFAPGFFDPERGGESWKRSSSSAG